MFSIKDFLEIIESRLLLTGFIELSMRVSASLFSSQHIQKYAYEPFSVILTLLSKINRIRSWVMKGQEMNLMEWQQPYGMEEACA